MSQHKDALAAAGSQHQLWIQNVVILCVALMSVLGACWIILSFIIFRKARTFRHQLILGLAICELIMALNFMVSTISNLSGNFIGSPEMKDLCQGNGFLTQWFVVQTDYWVLTIAICTYFLISDLQRASRWIQKNRFIVFSIPPLLSLVWASIGLSLRAYANIGAWCWFPSDRTRFLVNFISRWLIIFICLVIYLRLFVVVYNTHKRQLRNAAAETESSNPLDENKSLSSASIEILNRSTTDNATMSQKGSRSSSTSTVAITPHLKTIAYQMMTYPLIYMLIWSIPTSLRIYQSITNKPAPTPVATVDKACIAIQGFLDAVIYGYNETSIKAWRSFFSRHRQRNDAEEMEEV